MLEEVYYTHVVDHERGKGSTGRRFVFVVCLLLSLAVTVYGFVWIHEGFRQPSMGTSLSLFGSLSMPRLARVAKIAPGLQPVAPVRVRSPGYAPLQAVREVEMPALSSTMTEGKVVQWLKGPGDKVSKGESLVVIESDKADMDVESFFDGFLAGVVVEDGGTAAVGKPIAYIAETEAEIGEAQAKVGSAASVPAAAPLPDATESSASPAASAPTAPAEAPSMPSGRIVATPAAKQAAKSFKIDIVTVRGTGPFGRITLEDVEAAAGQAPAPAPAADRLAVERSAPAPAAPAPKPAPAQLRGKTVPFNILQATVAKNMEKTLDVPEFRVSYIVRMDKFEALYKKLKPHGVTMTAQIAKAVGLALEKHPIVNAAYSPEGIVYNDHINVAVAVAMDGGGLITPVLRDADTTDIYQMSRDWVDLVQRARIKKLSPDEFSGGTFSVSNLGMYGVDSFGALLPYGMAAILAVGGTKRVVAADEDGKIGVEKQMKMTLAADHRIVYGANSADFLRTLAGIMEDPDQLLVGR